MIIVVINIKLPLKLKSEVIVRTYGINDDFDGDLKYEVIYREMMVQLIFNNYYR